MFIKTLTSKILSHILSIPCIDIISALIQDENEFNETESVKQSVKSDSQSTLTTPMIPIDQSPRSVVTNDNNFIDVGRLNYLLGIVTLN